MPTSRGGRTNEDAIREQAYHLWEQDGKPFGRDNEYWQRALAASLAKPKRAKAAANGKAEKPAPKPVKAEKVVTKPAKVESKKPPEAKAKPAKGKKG